MKPDVLYNHKLLSPAHVLIALAIFCGLFALSYPYYRYFVDPDAVAYLTMAKRAAEGDVWRLVNALWSPLHPALVAVCVKWGMNALQAAQLTNGLACLLIIGVCYKLFRQFEIERFIGCCLLITLSVFLTYALYKQLFCDLWQIGLLLLYLHLITGKAFLQKPVYWVLCGVIAALATYAKVYSFYFLLLHLPLALWLLKRKAVHGPYPWKAYAVMMCVQLILMAPWVGLMHQKYGVWAFSESGALNTSWTLMGHKSLKHELGVLIPPPYFNSPYTWEDPYLSEGSLHSRFESLAMMKSQVGHSIQAALQGVEAANQISSCLLPVLIGSLLIVLFCRSQTTLDTNEKILLAAACIMPAGYLLLHFEARYIWLLLPVTMIIGALWLYLFRRQMQHELAYRLACVSFAITFIAYPLYDMKALFRKGEDIYRLAGILSALNIRASFTSNDNPSRSGCLAYWMSCNYYTPAKEKLSWEELLPELRRYNVTYYLHHQNALDVSNTFLLDESGAPFQRVDGGRIRGLQVFLISR